MLKTKKKDSAEVRKATRVNAAGYMKVMARVLILLTISLSLYSCKPRAQEPQWLEVQETRESAGMSGDRAGEEQSGAASDGQSLDAVGQRTESGSGSGTMSDGETQSEAVKTGMDAETEAPAQYYVHVCGAVVNPGVYILPEGSRVVDAVTAAGGTLEAASEEAVNQALAVTDGMQIYVPTAKEAETGLNWIHNGNETGAVTTGTASRGINSDSNLAGNLSEKVNINTADVTTLCTLPGIGESRAASIIAYREEHGGFATIEDIMKVSGIKDAAFGKIKDKICVK